MDLTDLIPRMRGRAKRELSYGLPVPLTEADIALLEIETKSVYQPLKELKEIHHTIARLLAWGHPAGEVARQTGYSQSRISILDHSPMFKELREFYRENRELEEVNYRERLRTHAIDQVARIEEHIEEKGDMWRPTDHIDYLKVLADRGGLGPESRTQSVNVNVNMAEAIRAGLARAEAAKSRVIDGEFVKTDFSGPSEASDTKIAVRRLGGPQEKG